MLTYKKEGPTNSVIPSPLMFYSTVLEKSIKIMGEH